MLTTRSGLPTLPLAQLHGFLRPSTIADPQLHWFVRPLTTGGRRQARAAFPNLVAGSRDSVAAPIHRDVNATPITAAAYIGPDYHHLNWALGAPIAAAVAGQLHAANMGAPPLHPTHRGVERAAPQTTLHARALSLRR
jgi:hypothetical protein